MKIFEQFLAWTGIIFLLLFCSGVLGALFFVAAAWLTPYQMGVGVTGITFAVSLTLLIREYVRG